MTRTATISRSTESNDNYRFDRFRMGLVLADLSYGKDALQAGDVLADHQLVDVDGKSASLYQLADGKPLVLITGSLSCPMTVAAMPNLVALERQHGAQLRFVLVNVREGHPGDDITQPKRMNDKVAHARRLREFHGVSWPVLVDDIDGSLHRQLDTMPNSLHIVAPDGTIIYRALFAGDRNAERAIARVAVGETPESPSSESMMQPVLNAAGYFHTTFESAGRGAYRDVALAAPPMVMMSLGARLFPFVAKDKRGGAFMAAMALGGAALAALALLL